MDGDDPKSVSEEKAMPVEPPPAKNTLDLFLTAKYFYIDTIEVVKYNEGEEFSLMYTDNQDYNTDSLVNEIMKISKNNSSEKNPKKLVICKGGSNGESSSRVYGITINEIEKINKLSELQNKGTNKKSECIIPKKVTHKDLNSSSKKTVKVVANKINLETGEISKKDITIDDIFFNDVIEMNVSTIYTTVANINAIYDVLFPVEEKTPELVSNEK